MLYICQNIQDMGHQIISNKELESFLKKKGLRLRKLRKAIKLNQQQFSERSGITQNQVSQIETGKANMRMITYYKYLIGLRND